MFVGFLLLSLVQARVFGADSTNLVTLTNALDIHHLSYEEVLKKHPVRLQGVVTYSDPEWRLLFIRDVTAGICLVVAGDAFPTNSELVEITGTTGNGSVLPIVEGVTWRHLGPGSMPVTRRISQTDRFARQIDCEWSELTGVVRSVAPLADNRSHFQIDVKDGEWRTHVFVPLPGKIDPAVLSQFVDAKISAIGVGGVDMDRAGAITGLKLFVPNLANIKVLEQPATNAFQLPVLSLSKVRTLSRTNTPAHRIHVRGIVSYLHSQHEVTLQDESGAVRLELTGTNFFRLGDALEVVGFIAHRLFSPILEDTVIRPIATKMSQNPVSTKPATVLYGDNDSKLLRITGVLQEQYFSGTNHILTLLEDGILYRALLVTTNEPAAWGQLKKGDLISVSGVCEIQGNRADAPQSFQVLLRSLNELVRLPPRPMFSMVQLMTMAGVVTSAWILVLFWGVTLKRRIREQTAIIRAGLEKESALDKQYRHLLENAALPVMIFHRQSLAILYTNQRAADRLYGSSTGHTYSLASECCDDPEVLHDMARNLPKPGQVTECEMCFKTVSGQRFWALICLSLIDYDQQPAIFLSFNDITEHKRMEADKEKLEAQNRQLQKAESLGRMAGAIAHHYNNLLSAIMGNLEITMNDLPKGGDVGENLAEAMKATRRAAEVSALMLTYLGHSTNNHERVDLSETCRQSLPMLQAILPKEIEFKADLPSPSSHILANPDQIHQTLTNLVTNAWEAIGEGKGLISLNVKTVSTAGISSTLRFPLDWRPHGELHACIEVTDTGCGIAARDLEKVFDPFFTSKFTGRGLGLSVVLGVVRAHGGVVTVESTEGRGSIFRVYFPVLATDTSATR